MRRSTDDHRFRPRDYLGRGFAYFVSCEREYILSLERTKPIPPDIRRQLIGSDVRELLEELENRVKIPGSQHKASSSLIRAWATDLKTIRDRWAHDHEGFPTDDAIRGLDTLERLITALSADTSAISSIRDMRHDLIQAHAMGLSRNGSFNGEALVQLTERMSIYDETHDSEDLARRDLTGKLLPMARQHILTSEEMLFLLRSVTYDAQRLREYARLTLDLQEAAVVDLVTEWLGLAAVRPKYRLACCVQYWDEAIRNEIVRGVRTALRDTEAAMDEVADSILDAILSKDVDGLITDPERSIDLSDSQRTDLLRATVRPLQEEFGRP